MTKDEYTQIANALRDHRFSIKGEIRKHTNRTDTSRLNRKAEQIEKLIKLVEQERDHCSS